MENNNFGMSPVNKTRDSPERTGKHYQHHSHQQQQQQHQHQDKNIAKHDLQSSPQRSSKTSTNNVHSSSSKSVVASSNGGVITSVLTPILNDVSSTFILCTFTL